MQTIISGYKSTQQLPDILMQIQCKKFMLVCGSSFDSLEVKQVFDVLPCSYVRFSHFTANPQYTQVEEGVALFDEAGCDALVAVGGGSAMDVAKCIKLFCKMFQEHKKVPLVAIPTTAGTGSESTRYAVYYRDGVKQSAMDESILPDYAILDASVLKNLPVYQKKCTMLDALSQAVESWWSVHSTDESKKYAKEAIRLILDNYKAYLDTNLKQAADNMLLGANLAGRAIHITQTTAVHAMSYKMTSLYGIPHGHAVGIGLPEVLDHMIDHTEDCVDSRGAAYLRETLQAIADCFECDSPKETVKFLRDFLKELEIESPAMAPEQLEVLTKSVNRTRLGNHPVHLDENTISQLYYRIGARCCEA